jgi:hypothetical protein
MVRPATARPPPPAPPSEVDTDYGGRSDDEDDA